MFQESLYIVILHYLGLQIASGGVISNTPLLLAVYYYNSCRPLHFGPGQHRREQGRTGLHAERDLDGQAGPDQHLLHHGQQEDGQQTQEEPAGQVKISTNICI